MKSLVEDLFVQQADRKKIVGFGIRNDLYAFNQHF